MSSLAELPELVGFFSYSREDDTDSNSALSMLRSRIQGELRGQLGRTAKTFRLWQDKEAIASGTLWESEIRNATAQSVFFIPIVTPTVVASPYCKFELESFLAREAALGRNDLIFPILYIDVPGLEDSAGRQNDPVLSLIAKRQYVDWRKLRHRDVHTTDVSEAVERFCTDIRNALRRSWVSPEERKRQEEAAAFQKAEDERQRREIEAKRRDEETRQQAEQTKARERVENERHEREAEGEQRRIVEAEAKRREQETALQREAEAERLRKAATAPASQAEQVGEVRQAVGEVPNRRTRPQTRRPLLLVAVGAVAIFVVGAALYITLSRPKPSPSASTATPSPQVYVPLSNGNCIAFQTRFFGPNIRTDVAVIGDHQNAALAAYAAANGFSVVDQMIYPTGTTDLTPFISRVFREKPAFVVFCGASIDLFKKQAGQLGLF
jgi:hypothetical protein